MCIFKKLLACLLVVAMLASVTAVVSAEETTVIGGVVGHSITEEAVTGFGLAFRIKMNVKGAQMNELKEFDQAISPVFREDIYEAISMKTCVEKRMTIGAPGAEAMKQVIEVYKKELAE